jgi:hypothetical protein
MASAARPAEAAIERYSLSDTPEAVALAPGFGRRCPDPFGVMVHLASDVVHQPGELVGHLRAVREFFSARHRVFCGGRRRSHDQQQDSKANTVDEHAAFDITARASFPKTWAVHLRC